MAKKKPTHQHKQRQPKEDAHQNPTTAMGDYSEKLENLKSLNSMLLKETVERRNQVDSLRNSIGSLESALTRSEMENQASQTELTRLHDLTDRLELQRKLVSVFVALQVSQQAEVVERERDVFWREKVGIEKKLGSLEIEMGEVLREKSEIERVRSERETEIELLKAKLRGIVVEIENERDGSVRVSRERDYLRAELDFQIEETNGLRLKLVEAEKRERAIEEKFHTLMVKYNGAVKEIEEREGRIESMTSERDSIDRCLAESNRVIEGLKREIEGIVREKAGIEEEKNELVMKKNKLESEVASLNEMVMGMQVEEQKLRLTVADLGKKYSEGMEKEKQMAKEIDELVRERKERERSFEGLVEEKGLVNKELGEALKELDGKKREIVETVRKKIEVEEAKMRKESEIVEIQRAMSELRGEISVLEASCNSQTKKNGKLQYEVNQYRDEVNQVSLERDEARKGFEKEKENGKILKGKILLMEKKIEETLKVVDEMKAENLGLLGEKKELESRSTMLVEEIASLKNSLLKARKEVDDMEAKVESEDAKSELVLKTLRKTAKAMEDGDFVDENMVGESVKPYVAEFEAIKNAFKKREIMVEEMKRELVFLQNSVAEAHKGKSFWTLVSSATTILAAASVASVAYVARGR